MKISVSEQKIACPRSQRLRGHAIFELAIEYLRENEKVRETACACSYGALVESYKKRKKGRKSRSLGLITECIHSSLSRYS